MIKQVYSRRLKRNVFRLDVRLSTGQRVPKFFLKRGEAEAVAYKMKHDSVARRFGLPMALDRPTLLELCKRYTDDIQNPREKTRTTRVLSYLRDLVSAGMCVDEITKADCKKYIDKRTRDGLKPQSIARELNIIVAMFKLCRTGPSIPASSLG